MTSVPRGPATRASRGSKSLTSRGSFSASAVAHVGRIAEDEVEPPLGRHRREQIALDELDPLGHAVLARHWPRRSPGPPG